MDPDVALEEILSGAKVIIATGLAQSEDAIKLADELLAIDEWLSKGGFLPQRWTEASMDGVTRGRSGL